MGPKFFVTNMLQYAPLIRGLSNQYEQDLAKIYELKQYVDISTINGYISSKCASCISQNVPVISVELVPVISA